MYVIDATAPADDKVFDTAAFEKFLTDKLKVGKSKPGQYGDKLKIERDAGKITITAVDAEEVTARYVKYMTKKFLKKNQVPFKYLLTSYFWMLTM